jgi:integrase
VKVVKARLGHATSKTTLDIYGHLWPDEEGTTRLVVEAELGQVDKASRVTGVSQRPI